MALLVQEGVVVGGVWECFASCGMKRMMCGSSDEHVEEVEDGPVLSVSTGDV